MNIKDLKKYDVVSICWKDTHIPINPSWMTESEYERWIKNIGCNVASIGIYMMQDKDFIYLVGDIDYDDVEENNVLRPISIIKSLITSVTLLKRGLKQE